MKYTCDVIIRKPKDQVASLFHDKRKYHNWMEGLENYEVLEGRFGEEGTISKLDFKLKGRDIKMQERVIENNLPDNYTVEYKSAGVLNIVKNVFEETEYNETKYSSINELRFSGIMKLFGFLMPGSFKKTSQKYLEDFKSMVESK